MGTGDSTVGAGGGGPGIDVGATGLEDGDQADMVLLVVLVAVLVDCPARG